MRKTWYNIELECIKYNKNGNLKVGEKDIIAKVKSKGLAYNCKEKFETIYDKEFYKITIK